MAAPQKSHRKPRMQSTVRVRRSHGSPFSNFIDRHFPGSHSRSSSPDRSSSTTSDLPQTQTTGPAKRPRLGTADGDGRRASGRSIVETLAAQDRADYLEQTSGSGKAGTTKIPKARGRATDGHAPQLARVTEDDSSPSASSPHLPDTLQEAEEGTTEDSSTDSAPGITSDRDQAAGISPRQRALSTSAYSVSRSSVHATPGESRSNDMFSPLESNTRSGETRFLTPPNTGRKASPLPEKADSPSSGTGSPRTNRLIRQRSDVSIPTPISEESRTPGDSEYDVDNHTDDVADYLDVVDPEVGALGYLSNIGNSIFFPHIPALYDRRPTHNLPSTRRRGYSVSTIGSQRRSSINSARSRHSVEGSGALEEGRVDSPENALKQGLPRPRRPSVMSRMSSAVGFKRKDEDDEEFVKHIKDWRDMDEEERDELDEHVRMLLTKKSKFKRGAKGFYAFVKTPMGFIMTLYGFLVTFWGTAIVLFIFGWIHVGHRKRYWIEICDQILCALFAAVGLGFAPFRAVDTYRMIHIAHYHHLTWKRRKQLGLSELNDPNDLPRPEHDRSNQVSRHNSDAEAALPGSVSSSEHSLINRSDTGTSSQKAKKHHKHLIHHKKIIELPQDVTRRTEEANAKAQLEDLAAPKIQGTTALKRNESIQSELIKEKEDVVVLTRGEQEVLEYHQRKFHASHTFYRYHATSTHHAFPLDLMIVIVCLLDCHSLLQAALGGCTWGIKYTHRPTALTASIISCSLSCNAVAGIIIWLGGRRTKKREEVERRLRIALEQEALAKIERRRARGELPGRDHQTPDEKTRAEDQLAADKTRDAIHKGLGHLEGASSKQETSAKSTNMEMKAIKTTAEGSLLR